jgi:hypothetical protein
MQKPVNQLIAGSPNESTTQQGNHAALTDVEKSVIACFVEVGKAFNLPRSTCEIFGLVFASPEPVPFEMIRERLGLSKASTSTGLKSLQKMGVLHTVYVPGDRRTFYDPEEDLDKGFRFLVRDLILPHLKNAGIPLKGIKGQTHNTCLLERLARLEAWKPDLTGSMK